MCKWIVVGFVCCWGLVFRPAQGQPLVFVPNEAASNIVDIYHPRTALAPDGSFAVALEVLVQLEFTQEWRIAVQRFSPSGSPLGTMHFFQGKSCGWIWTSDYVEHPAVAYLPNGILLVLMQHTGDFHIGGDAVRSAEARLGAIDPNGQVIDINPGSGNCEELDLVFVGGNRQDRPRMALTPAGDILITLDGFFDGSDLRNVAIRVLNNEGTEVIEQLIPHDDPRSQQSFHMRPDIATNGSVILSVWQECPIVDNQGNANECDVGAQFASITGTGLQAM